jgi:hypothetical protein
VGVLNWYTAATGGNVVNTGSSFNPAVSATTTWYVEASAGGTYNVGPANPSIGTQFPVSSTDWGLSFNVTQQISLDRVYVSPGGTSGAITINLRSVAGGPILNTKTVNVTAFSGLQPISLGWTINPGNGYRLELATGSVQLYYNSFGAAYPYTFPGSSVTITGFFNPNAGTTNFYYFFYNWEITEGCKSNRIPVTAVVNAAVSVPTINAVGNILSSSSFNNNQWYLNGNAIPGATGTTYNMSLTGAGTYTVVVTDPATGCSATSLPFIFTGLAAGIEAAGIAVYPNPATDKITIELPAAGVAEALLKIYDKLGALVMTQPLTQYRSDILLNMTPGSYTMELTTSGGVYYSKLVRY